MEQLFCKYCHFEEALEQDNVPHFCSDCGEPLYVIQIPPAFYVSNNRIKGKIQIESKSADEIKLKSFRFFKNLLVHYDSSNVIHRYQSKIFKIDEPWNYPELIEVHPEIEIEVNGYYKLITFTKPLYVFPVPRFNCAVPNKFVVSPFTGFKGKITIELLNESAIYLKGVTIENAKPPDKSSSRIIKRFRNTYEPESTEYKQKNYYHFKERLFIKGKGKKHEILISFPPNKEFTQKYYRIIPRLYPEDVVKQDELPSCECWVEYKINPQVRLAIQRWTNKGMAWLSYLEGNEFPYKQKYTIISPLNSLQMGVSGLRKFFDELYKKQIEFYVPIGEKRIRKILPFLSTHIKEDDRILSDFPCILKCKNSHTVPDSIYWRKVPPLHKSNPLNSIASFTSIKNELSINALKEIEYIEILFDLKNAKKFIIEISMLFPCSDENYEENFKIIVSPYIPLLFEEPVSIDFGTTNSCIAMDIGFPRGKGEWLPEGVINCLPIDIFQSESSDEGQANIIPSILAYKPLFNKPSEVLPFIPNFINLPLQICENFKIDFLMEFLFNKQIIHPDYNVSTEKQIYDYFRVLIERIKVSFEDRKIFTTILSNLALTVPTSFTGSIREKYKQIIEEVINSQIGLPSSITLSYPQDEALAVLQFALERHNQKVENDTLVGVIDFGGGTIDINFIYIKNNIRYLLSIGGSNHFGGTTIDRWFLARLLLDPVSNREKLIPRSPNDWRLYNLESNLREQRIQKLTPELRGLLSRLKWYLEDENQFCSRVQSFVNKVNSFSNLSMSIEWKNKKNIIDLLKNMFEEKFQQIVEEILLDSICRALEKKSIEVKSKPFKLLLILAGNASRIFGFQKNIELTIKNHFSRKFDDMRVYRLENPKEALALGARSYVGIKPMIDKTTFAPFKSYYIKVSPLSTQNGIVKIGDNYYGFPIFIEGMGKSYYTKNHYEKVIKYSELEKYEIDLNNKFIQVLEKSGIDINLINIKCPIDIKKNNIVKFILTFEGVLGINELDY